MNNIFTSTISRINLSYVEWVLNKTIWSIASKDLLLFVCNKAYLRPALGALASANIYTPDSHKIIYAINIDKSVCERIEKEFDNVTVIRSSCHLPFNYERAFCANVRVNIINKLLNLDINRLIYVDVDSLFLRDPFKYYENMEKEDNVGILIRNSKKEKWRCATGVIYVQNSNNTRKFFNSWAEAVRKDLFSWYTDQITFHRCVKSVDGRINLHRLSKKCIDWDYQPDSYIWVRKGDHQEKQQEYNKKLSGILVNEELEKLFNH